jgi:hypothetical protein
MANTAKKPSGHLRGLLADAVVGGKGTMWIKVIAVLLGVATMTVMQNGLGIE